MKAKSKAKIWQYKNENGEWCTVGIVAMLSFDNIYDWFKTEKSFAGIKTRLVNPPPTK